MPDSAPDTHGPQDQPDPPALAAPCIPTEYVRSLVDTLYPTHMTETAKRLFEAACHEVEDPPDEDYQQAAT